MRLLLALYDPGVPPQAGSYWSWRSSAIPLSLLDGFFYEAANKNRPDDPAALGEACWQGGVAKVNDEYLAAYRFVDGGRDWHGRPGRWVLVVAFVRVIEAEGREAALPFQIPEFERVARQAPSERPVSVPASLEIELETPPGDDCLTALRKLAPAAAGALEDAARKLKQTAAGLRWHCAIRISDEAADVRFTELLRGGRQKSPRPTTSALPPANGLADAKRPPPNRDNGRFARVAQAIAAFSRLRRFVQRKIKNRKTVVVAVAFYLLGGFTGWMLATATDRNDKLSLPKRMNSGRREGNLLPPVPALRPAPQQRERGDAVDLGFRGAG